MSGVLVGSVVSVSGNLWNLYGKEGKADKGGAVGNVIAKPENDDEVNRLYKVLRNKLLSGNPKTTIETYAQLKNLKGDRASAILEKAIEEDNRIAQIPGSMGWSNEVLLSIRPQYYLTSGFIMGIEDAVAVKQALRKNNLTFSQLVEGWISFSRGRQDSGEKKMAASFLLNRVKIYKEEIISPLIEALNKKENQSFVGGVLSAIGEMAVPALINALRNDDIGIIVVAILAKIGRPAIPKLMEAANSKTTWNIDNQQEIRQIGGICVSLAKMGKGGYQSLIRLLKSNDSVVSAAASTTAVMVGGPMVFPLIRALNEGNAQSHLAIEMTLLLMQLKIQDPVLKKAIDKAMNKDIIPKKR